MLFKTKDCVIAVVVIHIFLFAIYYMVDDKSNSETSCEWLEPCVRFCCEKNSNCEDAHIRDTFNASLLKEFFLEDTLNGEDTNGALNYLILHGRPKCTLEEVGINRQWHFYWVAKITSLECQILVKM